MSVRRPGGTRAFPAGGQIDGRAKASPRLGRVRLLAAVLASAVWVAWWLATPRLAPRTACLLWLAALALWLAALFTRWTIPRWHRATTWLTVIVALSVLPRALWLASAPYKVEQDEVVIPLYGLKVLGSQPWEILRGASAYFATPYLTHVLQAWPCLFAPPLLGARTASLLLAIASLVATYALAARLFGRLTAVLAATLLACSWWHMAYARTAFPYMQPILMLPLALHVLVYGIEEDHRFFQFLGGILLGVSVLVYTPARVVIPVFWAWLAHRLFFRKRGISAGCRAAAVVALGMVIAASPYVHNYGVAGTLSRYRATTTTGQGLLHQLSVDGWASAAAGQLVRRQLYAATHIYYTGGAWLAVHDYSSGPLLDPVSLCLALGGLVIAIVKLRDDRCFLLVTWVGATFFGGQVLTDVPYSAYRAAPILPALAIAAGYAGARLVGLARRWYLPWRPAWQLAGLAALIAVVLPLNLAKLRRFLAVRDSDPGTGMARLIGSESPGPVYYLVSTGPLSELYTIRFLDEGRTVRDVASLTDSLGTDIDSARDAVFVLNPALNGALPILRRCYPGGFLWSAPHAGGAYPVLAFWVPQPAVAAGRNCDMRPPPGIGLLARYFAGADWDGAVVRERVEDWPLRWKTTADLKQFRSVMWSGWLQVPLTGTYRFQLQTFQGALGTARVGDVVRLDPTHGIASGTLQHAKYPLQIHCRMPLAGFCALAWFPPGGAPDFKVIPPAFLRPASAAAAQSFPLR